MLIEDSKRDGWDTLIGCKPINFFKNYLINSINLLIFYRLIDNIQERGFVAKMRRLGEAVLHFVGVPSSVVFYKKYLIRSKAKPDAKTGTVEIPDYVRHEKFEIVDTFLRQEVNNSVERRVRRRVSIIIIII